MKKLSLFFRYLIYLIRSKNAHGVHSPFIFDLVSTVIYNKREFYSFGQINKIRMKLLKNNNQIRVQDFGAGSMHSNSKKKAVKDIAQHSAKSKKYGELLFRLTNKFEPNTILELGTSLGISGLYLASAAKNAKFITMEASAEQAEIAEENFRELNLLNVEVCNGSFEEKLIESIQKLNALDFVFFDGNHTKEATLSYFYECLKYGHPESVFIFDDIHWSTGMEAAWKEIKSNPCVTVTIDLFFLGIVFFHTEQVKENFRIRF